MKIIWTETALETYEEIVNYISYKFTIKEAVRFFVIDYKNNELFEDRLSVIQNNV